MTVYLVGAGPGDPGLLTVRGAQLIASAAVVVYDRLTSAEILALAQPDAEMIDVGKRAGYVTMPQSDINQVLVDRGLTGASVVRLKGGDPYVFGRGGEEAAALLEAGVAFENIPGITSAIAAPAAAGIPVTLRNEALSFTVVTGHEDPGSAQVNWEALAQTGGTIVILMGVGRIAKIAARLLAGGLAPQTPVAAIRWGTTPQQEVMRTTLAEVGTAGLESPSTIVVGNVASLDLLHRQPGQ